MKKANWKRYALWIGVCLAVGALSGFLTKDATKAYEMTVTKPPLTPPGVVFPIVWSVLFVLLGIGAARVSVHGENALQKKALLAFWVQLGVNFFWSIIFFNLQAYGFALAWLALLLGLVVWMSVLFFRIDRISAVIQIPYLLWLVFAFYLNFGVWRLNP